MNENTAAPTPSNHWKYSPAAIVLHWILAAMITTMLAVGWYMTSIEDDPGSGWLFDLHKLSGILVFALVLLRLVWRLSHPPAALPRSVPGWEASISLLGQRALYACMFLMPVLGLAGASYGKEGLRVFGLQLPTPVAPNHDLAERFFDLHGVLAWVLVALVALHTAAGLKHLLVDKDGVFQRMWFR